MDHPINVTFIRLIVLLPLCGAAINFLAGWWLQKTFGKRAISLVGCGVVILAFILALRGFFAMLGLPPENRFMLDDLWRWFDVGGLNLDIAFWLDPLSMIMTLIITGVGGLIHIYSIGYMHDDERYWRFFGFGCRLRDAPDVVRSDRQISVDSALRMAAGRDGGSDTGGRVDSRRHDGRRGRVHGRETQLSVLDVAVYVDGDRGDRRDDRV